MTLTEFLLARIAEDEDYYTGVADTLAPRILAECEAKRRIVEGAAADGSTGPWGGCGDDCEWRAIDWAIQQLARPYADHLDYRDEWRR
jgi:hypothetical protein